MFVTQQDLGDRGGTVRSNLDCDDAPSPPPPSLSLPSLPSNKYFIPLQMIVVIFEDGWYS